MGPTGPCMFKANFQSFSFLRLASQMAMYEWSLRALLSRCLQIWSSHPTLFCESLYVSLGGNRWKIESYVIFVAFQNQSFACGYSRCASFSPWRTPWPATFLLTKSRIVNASRIFLPFCPILKATKTMTFGIYISHNSNFASFPPHSCLAILPTNGRRSSIAEFHRWYHPLCLPTSLIVPFVVIAVLRQIVDNFTAKTASAMNVQISESPSRTCFRRFHKMLCPNDGFGSDLCCWHQNGTHVLRASLGWKSCPSSCCSTCTVLVTQCSCLSPEHPHCLVRTKSPSCTWNVANIWKDAIAPLCVFVRLDCGEPLDCPLNPAHGYLPWQCVWLLLLPQHSMYCSDKTTQKKRSRCGSSLTPPTHVFGPAPRCANTYWWAVVKTMVYYMMWSTSDSTWTLSCLSTSLPCGAIWPNLT